MTKTEDLKNRFQQNYNILSVISFFGKKPAKYLNMLIEVFNNFLVTPVENVKLTL